jgi:hypothetical protein
MFIPGCDKSAGLIGDDSFVPDFSNEWQVIKGTASYDGFIFVTPTITDTPKGKGTLDGSFNGQTGQFLKVAGTFTNTKLFITIRMDTINPGTPPLSDSTFTGIYDTLARPHVWRLVNTAPPHDSLVLQRN